LGTHHNIQYTLQAGSLQPPIVTAVYKICDQHNEVHSFVNDATVYCFKSLLQQKHPQKMKGNQPGIQEILEPPSVPGKHIHQEYVSLYVTRLL